MLPSLPKRLHGTGQIRWFASRQCYLAELVVGKGERSSKRISKTFKPANYKSPRAALQAAETWLAEQNLLKKRGTLLEPSRITVVEWANEYLKTPTWKSKTKGDYEDYLNRFVKPHLGHLRLQELSPAQVQRWASTVSATPYQRAKALHYFKLCLNRAVDLELIHRNPARKVKVEKPRPAPQEAWDALEARKVLKHLEATNPYFYCYVYLNLTTGLRREEMLGLKWKYVSLEGHYLDVVEVCTYHHSKPSFGRPKTPGSQRRVYLDAGTVAVLLEQWEYCQMAQAIAEGRAKNTLGKRRVLRWANLGLVFPSRAGGPLSETTLSQLMRDLAAELGVTHIPPKNLRHTHVSLLDSTGRVPIHVAAQRSGHSKAVREQHYQARLERQQREAALGIDELLG